MTRLKDHLSALIFDQIPEFAQVEYPLFAEFLKAYYSFLEQDQKAQEVLQNIQEYGDIDDTVEFLIRNFFDQYGEDIPETISADKRLFLKRLSDMYGSKGTEKGYRFLFNVLYNETIDFFYPQNEILKASDGKWIRTFTLSVYPDNNSDPFKFENTRITGDISGATAIVNHVIKYIENGLVVYELSLDTSSITGNFRSFEKLRASKLIRVDGSNTSFATVRADLETSEVYSYYAARISELRNILLNGNASKQVATRRLANLGVQYGWTDQEVVNLYNDLFKESLTVTLWQRINPLITHPIALNTTTSFAYYSDNPAVFRTLVTENNAEESTIIERILTVAREFNWTAEQLVSVVNPALGRNYASGDWRQALLPVGPVYEEITGFLYPMLAEIDIVTPGLGYLPGDTVEVTSNSGVGALAEVISITPTGGILNVRVLESGVNYTTNTVLTPVKLATNKVTARQLLRSNVASVVFDRDHGLKYGDAITIADESTPTATGSNVLLLNVCSAGGSATLQDWGVYANGNLVHRGNATHTVSVYNTYTMSFVEHITYNLSQETDETQYASNVYNNVGYPLFSEFVVERNLANVAYSVAASNESNVAYTVSTQATIVNIVNLPAHANLRVEAKIHVLDDWTNNDSADIIIPILNKTHLSTIARVNNGIAPTLSPDDQASMTYVGKQNYSRSVSTGSIVMDTSKLDDFTLSDDCNIVARTSITNLGQPALIIQPNVIVFGYYNSNEATRSVQRTIPFDFTGHSSLIFETIKGGGLWGEEPEASEYLNIEYSLDNGQTWDQLHQVDPTVAPIGTWEQHNIPVPGGLQNQFGLIRYSMPAASVDTSPRDCWAATSIVTSLDALSIDNGYVNYDSGWLPHTTDSMILTIRNTLPAGSKKMFVSNVVVRVIAAGSAAMAAKLNSLNNNEIVLVHTYDDASAEERFNDGLPAAMGRIGASIFTNQMSQETAYVCIGKVGFQPGQAIEKIADYGDFDARNQVCVDAKLDNGNIVGQSIVVGSIPDDRTIKYEKQAPDSDSNVDVYFESEAVLVANIAPMVISDPFWKNNDGKLNENMYVQGRSRLATEDDPVYYQQFSYVIRTEHPISEWRKYAYDLMHPGGIALFGELKLQTIPEDVIDMSPAVVSGVEIQDFFAITADKAQRTGPTTPDFRASMTVFPPPSNFNPKKLTLNSPTYARCIGKVPSDYVTVECMFVKEKDLFPTNRDKILFSKFLSYEVKTNDDKIYYRVMRQGFQWAWVDSGYAIAKERTYVLHLSYDGTEAKLFINGKLVHRASNRELSLALTGAPGVLANQNRHHLLLNDRNIDLLSNAAEGIIAGHRHSYLVMRVYDKALSDAEITGNYEHLRDLFDL